MSVLFVLDRYDAHSLQDDMLRWRVGGGRNNFFLDCGRESLVVEIDLDMARYDVVLVKGQATYLGEVTFYLYR